MLASKWQRKYSSVIMSRNLSPFPRPFIITVGVPKGGANKTWTTLNVASQFGLWGYDVLAIDTNAQHDLFKDWHDITLDGLWPRFEVIWHQPFDKNDEQAPLLDLTPHARRQFIFYDTGQYYQLKTTRWAWMNCHALILPVSPHMDQLGNFENGIETYQALPGKKGPIIVLPCQAKVLKNSKAQERFQDILPKFEKMGCSVPKRVNGAFYGQRDMVPLSEMGGLFTNRWIFAEATSGGALKRHSNDFILRVQMNIAWIRGELESIYGWFPEPKLPPIDTRNREEMLRILRAEHLARVEKPKVAVG